MGLWDKLFGSKESPKEEGDDLPKQTFADVTRGFTHCVNQAQELVERHYLQIMDRYFDDEPEDRHGNKKQRPKLLSFKIAKDYVVHVPMVCLIPPSGLTIDELEVEMAMRINKHQLKKASAQEHAHKDHITRSSFEVDFAPMHGPETGGSQNMMKVKMKFKAKEPPEGVSRVIDAYTNTVIPMRNGDTPPEVGRVVGMDTDPDGDGSEENFAEETKIKKDGKDET
jgi:hypothetical protein